MNIFKSFAAGIMLILLIIFPDTVISSAIDSLSACINILFPSLFPFFVLSKIFIKSGGAYILGKFFNSIMYPLFRINGNGASAFVLGILCGYPVGAKTASDLYNQSYITKKEAENLICFCNNSGPLFIIGAVGVSMLSSKSAGIFLYAVHILSAITSGFILKFSLPETKKLHSAHIPKTEQNIFTSSVEESMMTIINVFAYVIFFGIAMDICEITNIFYPFSSLISSFNIATGTTNSVLSSVFEMTTGIKKLNETNASFSLKLILISFMLGWSGFSIHFQTKSVLKNFDFPFKKYIFAKLMHGIIAVIYAVIGCAFVPFEKSVFINTSTVLTPVFNPHPSLFIIAAAIAIIYITVQRRLKYNTRY